MRMLRLFYHVFGECQAPPIGLDYALQCFRLFSVDPYGRKYSWNDAEEDGGKKDSFGTCGHGLRNTVSLGRSCLSGDQEARAPPASPGIYGSAHRMTWIWGPISSNLQHASWDLQQVFFLVVTLFTDETKRHTWNMKSLKIWESCKKMCLWLGAKNIIWCACSRFLKISSVIQNPAVLAVYYSCSGRNSQLEQGPQETFKGLALMM